MGKKKAKDRSSREDDEFEMTGPVCRHIRKGTDQTLLRKISDVFDGTRCQDCKNEDNKENRSTDPSGDSEDENDSVVEVWMCMKCGHRGCGRSSENQHAIKHYETPRSDTHCLVISLDSWSVWCYECDDEVRYSASSQLAQLVSNIKKKMQLESVQKTETKNDVLEVRPKSVTFKTEEDEDKENVRNRSCERKTTRKVSVCKSPNSSSSTEDNSGVPVRGLSNLGNTCFFNAVIQNLSQTQMLRQTLNKVIEDKTSLSVKPATSSTLEAVVAELDRPGSLTMAMNQLLNEIQESKKGVVTPLELFAQVCKKAARFKGFQQQDSQELLRYLLDGMRAEESKRVSSAITEALKRSGKVTDAEELKSVIKEYEKNGLPQNFVDQVFGGEMTSTIMCQQCKTVSVVTEMFLDLSLPVSDQAYRKKTQKRTVRKSSEASEDGPESQGEDVPAGSKYQQKKAKKQAKKQAKHQKRQQKLESRVSFNSLASLNQAKDLAEDVEKREGDSAQTGIPEQNPPTLDAVQPDKEEDKGDSVNNSHSESSCNRFTASPEARCSSDGVLDDDDFLLANEMEKINLNDAFIESDSVETCPESEDDGPGDEAKEYVVVNQDPELAFQTLARRPSPDKQECSVESCLFHFTEEEILSENNSLLCVCCTKRQANKDKSAGSKKNVYTEASKQMLISSPPPVLTLHLKRFQQNGYGICKVNRHVPFPLILDLAPFCALKSKNVVEGERQILYSLYGIVEHSGTMRSGHYTAFVKVRPKSSKLSSSRLEGEPPQGSWFHISDTSVQPVSESRVQSSQAYLLFYERIR
ncbi:ubiquitin carboxyl-terminal hydrolase 16 isoform X2 [Hippocampus comes]|uniref:Ubiquitin carboxyl-terminal hydrolase n=2 Tax=Hippocampus comes TaxID=109280 RepID=A0A3Q2ZKL6_HIPCM|nr:PREDICTED: ubiquitin carboxyl-terminal hydrolase 16 isoform X2 [Hippocampus comes]XP_019750227.1 PREDICTED: ubiquitin carboxyl-terminal hydrolase 16 isoform X2 [Hippocampus comes]